jgi:hypothetical protein
VETKFRNPNTLSEQECLHEKLFNYIENGKSSLVDQKAESKAHLDGVGNFFHFRIPTVNCERLTMEALRELSKDCE